MNYQISTKKTLRIHAFIGGKCSSNFRFISPAISRVERLHRGSIELDVQYLDFEEMRQDRWTAVQFGKWLADSDIYIMSDHVTLGFQKMADSPQYRKDHWEPWDISTLGDLLHHYLNGHIGFPQDVRCPVLLQNKITYKEALADVCPPFLVLNRTSDGKLSKETKRLLFNFCWDNYEIPRAIGNKGGFVLKVPATPHSYGRFFCDNIYDVVRCFKRLCLEKAFAWTPSFFLEPRLANRKEMKVVITENDVTKKSMPLFYAKNQIEDSGKDFKAFEGRHDVFQFALKAKEILKQNCPFAICTPVLRVDVIEDQQGCLKVNELESLDAFVEAYGRHRAKLDPQMANFKETFFFDKINELVTLSTATSMNNVNLV